MKSALIEAIKKRRSIRVYAPDKPIKTNVLKTIIDAARYAPTARGDEPWEFIVVKKKAMLEKLANLTDHGKFIKDAGALIAVYSRETKYYLEDCSAATQNILLAASAFGIGTCWVAGDKKKYCQKISIALKTPSKFKLVSLISLGYPKRKNEFRVIQKRPIKEIFHNEKF
ncbi:MAG: nitroreductase family protein [Elusimicrobia bacterium]|nr:nitroreductase family protein [Elusimicrobiota bacterium]